MDPIATGFWGAFFGAAALLLAGALLLLVRGMRRAAFMAAVATGVPLLYTLAYLGWLSPGDPDTRLRMLAHVSAVSGVILCLMLLSLLRHLRRRRAEWLAYGSLGGACALVLLVSWALPPFGGFLLSCLFAMVLSAAMLVVCLRDAKERNRVAVDAFAGLACIVVGQGCLNAIVLMGGAVPWPVHALAAGSGVVYLAIMASALWLRVLRAIELREVMALGPGYDTVTRMHAYTEAGKVVGAYFRKAGKERTVGVVAVSIANLRALESLHGRAAHNHALFVCASRLRKCAPLGAELCRMGEDGFLMLMLMHGPQEAQLLAQLARQVRRQLLRPIALSTGTEPAAESGRMEWMPEVGVGIATSGAEVTPGNAVVAARTVSRTAWGFVSRMASSDSATSGISELPVEAGESSPAG